MGQNIFHRNFTTASGIHIVHSFEYADEAARSAATGFTANDVGKAAFVQDVQKLYVLTSHSPIVWKDLTGAGGGSGTDSDAVHVNVADEIAQIAEKTVLNDDDWILVEDSEDSNNKKKVRTSNARIPTSSIQAIVGAMFTGNDEVGIQSSYDATSKKIDLNVPHPGTPTSNTLYYDTQVSSDPSTFDAANAESTPATSGTQTITIPTYTGSEHFVIAQLNSDPAITSIIIGGVEQFGGFTPTTDAFVFNSGTYNAWVSNQALLGSVMSGVSVTIGRS